jgi:hypothetical protein
MIHISPNKDSSMSRLFLSQLRPLAFFSITPGKEVVAGNGNPRCRITESVVNHGELERTTEMVNEHLKKKKRWKNRKITIFKFGKSTISIRAMFNSYVTNCQRVMFDHFPPVFPQTWGPHPPVLGKPITEKRPLILTALVDSLKIQHITKETFKPTILQ